MVKTIDARGLSCPAPVLLVKEALDQGELDSLMVVVDSESCRENVIRFLGTRNYTVTEAKKGGVYQLKGRRGGNGAGPRRKPPVADSPAPDKASPPQAKQRILIIVAGDRLGSGDDGLGEKLMINYLRTVKELGRELWQLVFINSGVKLTTDASPVLPELQGYERDGVHVLACGTCLDHFGLTAAKKVGGTTNMLDIVTASQLADKVITIG